MNDAKNKQPLIVTDDAETVKLQTHHAKVQEGIAQLSPERQAEVRAQQAEVDFEISKVNAELEESSHIEAKWRNATGLHHSKVEEIISYVRTQSVGNIVRMYGKDWVFTPLILW